MTDQQHDGEKAERPCTVLTYEDMTYAEFDPKAYERMLDMALREYLTIMREEHSMGTLEDFCCWISNTAASHRDHL